MKSDKVIRLAKLGLEGNKKELVEYIQVLAAESANKNKTTLYTGLVNLLESSYEPDLVVTSAANSSSRQDDLWFARSVRRRIDRVVLTYKSNSMPPQYRSKFNKVLLYGPPGSGKTTLGHYIAHELNKPIEYIKLSDIVSFKFGETLKNLALAFETNKDSIIFIDEFDAFAKSRFDSNDVGELKRIVNSLIQTLDVLSGDRIVIVATNLKDEIDPAILRRFPIKLNVPELNKLERHEFIEFLISRSDIPIVLKPSEFGLFEEIMIALNLKTIDSIRSLFDATVMNSHIRNKDSVQFPDLLETMITDGVIDGRAAKKIQDTNPEIIKNMLDSLQTRLTKSEIAEFMGIHRNSLNNYAQ